MPGPKPAPTRLKLLRGNPGKRAINSDEFKPLQSLPKAPMHIQGEARKEWRRIVAELESYGMVSEVDRGALAMLCTCWARYVSAEKMIAEAAEAQPAGYGLFVRTPGGMPVQSPWVAVSNRAMEQYRAWCAEFGLTPAARVRVTPMTSRPVPVGVPALGTGEQGWEQFTPRERE